MRCGLDEVRVPSTPYRFRRRCQVRGPIEPDAEAEADFGVGARQWTPIVLRHHGIDGRH